VKYMEESKELKENENDSIASNDEFSSDESSEKSGNGEEAGDNCDWKSGYDLFDSDFPSCCEQYFTQSNDIEALSKADITSPIKCFLKIFSNFILNKIVTESINHYTQQITKGVIKKSENHSSTVKYT